MPTGLSTAVDSRPPQSARATALSVLVKSIASADGVDVLLERALSSSSLDLRDRGLVQELAYGVLRRLRTLDWRLEPVLDKPLSRLPLVVQMILRLGAYQIMFLDRIPQSAAVNESVKLAQMQARALRRDWSGFVNAVLRQLIRAPVPPWPVVETDAAKALAVRYSVPEWLSARWIGRLGIAVAEAVCEQSSRIPPLTLRVNRLKISREEYLTILRGAHVPAKPTSISPVGVLLEEGRPIPSLPGFREGFFYVEDEAAQLIPPLLDLQPGQLIVDACAAPGGKATHMAELIGDQGTIYALDRIAERLSLLRDNCARLGIKSVVPLAGDARHPSAWLQAVKERTNCSRVDRILVDAPCSGLGVLRRHPEAKWRKDSSGFERHHRLQLEILNAVAPCLRPGGVLVYSTCSVEPEENETVIEDFCRIHTDFRRESVAPWLPSAARGFLTQQGDFSTIGNRHSMDSFYAARLKKAP